jgi:hypothetical protein
VADEGLPPCGLYRTTQAIGEQVPAGRLVYFHNHGDPGPGVYLPTGWRQNRALFDAQGVLLPGRWWAASLDAVAPEGFYRVRETFFCCDNRCQTFETDQLVQLGYTAEADPLVFVLEVIDSVLIIPDRGARVDRSRLAKLHPLKTPVSTTEPGLQ